MSATATDSRYSGYLKPTQSSDPIEVLEGKIQDFIAGCTGLNGALVRPAYKNDRAEPPSLNVLWCAFFISEVNERDWALETFKHEVYKQSSTQSISVLCSFYGSGAWECASTLRDAVQIEQNRSELYRQSGLKFLTAGNLISVGDTYLNRWRDRVDLRLNFSRIKTRRYDIKAVAGASVVGHTEQRQNAFKVDLTQNEDK